MHRLACRSPKRVSPTTRIPEAESRAVTASTTDPVLSETPSVILRPNAVSTPKGPPQLVVPATDSTVAPLLSRPTGGINLQSPLASTRVLWTTIPTPATNSGSTAVPPLPLRSVQPPVLKLPNTNSCPNMAVQVNPSLTPRTSPQTSTEMSPATRLRRSEGPCVLYTTIPLISRVFPVGHVAVMNSSRSLVYELRAWPLIPTQNAVWVLEGRNDLSLPVLFGRPVKALPLAIPREHWAAFDAALEEETQKWRYRMHKGPRSNCHTFICDVLNNTHRRVGGEGEPYISVALGFNILTHGITLRTSHTTTFWGSVKNELDRAVQSCIESVVGFDRRHRKMVNDTVTQFPLLNRLCFFFLTRDGRDKLIDMIHILEDKISAALDSTFCYEDIFGTQEPGTRSNLPVEESKMIDTAAPVTVRTEETKAVCSANPIAITVTSSDSLLITPRMATLGAKKRPPISTSSLASHYSRSSSAVSECFATPQALPSSLESTPHLRVAKQAEGQQSSDLTKIPRHRPSGSLSWRRDLTPKQATSTTHGLALERPCVRSEASSSRSPEAPQPSAASENKDKVLSPSEASEKLRSREKDTNVLGTFWNALSRIRGLWSSLPASTRNTQEEVWSPKSTSSYSRGRSGMRESEAAHMSPMTIRVSRVDTVPAAALGPPTNPAVVGATSSTAQVPQAPKQDMQSVEEDVVMEVLGIETVEVHEKQNIASAWRRPSYDTYTLAQTGARSQYTAATPSAAALHARETINNNFLPGPTLDTLSLRQIIGILAGFRRHTASGHFASACMRGHSHPPGEGPGGECKEITPESCATTTKTTATASAVHAYDDTQAPSCQPPVGLLSGSISIRPQSIRSTPITVPSPAATMPHARVLDKMRHFGSSTGKKKKPATHALP